MQTGWKAEEESSQFFFAKIPPVKLRGYIGEAIKRTKKVKLVLTRPADVV